MPNIRRTFVPWTLKRKQFTHLQPSLPSVPIPSVRNIIKLKEIPRNGLSEGVSTIQKPRVWFKGFAVNDAEGRLPQEYSHWIIMRKGSMLILQTCCFIIAMVSANELSPSISIAPPGPSHSFCKFFQDNRWLRF